jgi:hypothetical protein
MKQRAKGHLSVRSCHSATVVPPVFYVKTLRNLEELEGLQAQPRSRPCFSAHHGEKPVFHYENESKTISRKGAKTQRKAQ